MTTHIPENLMPPLGDKSETLDNQNDSQKKYDNMPNGDVYNNTLYYIKENIGTASEDVITEACVDRFSEVQIETAKITLLEKYEVVLNGLDAEKTAEIKKPCRDSNNRPAAYAVVKNIIEAFLILDAHGKVINIVDSKAMDDTLINPEALSGKAVLTRFKDIEKKTS